MGERFQYRWRVSAAVAADQTMKLQRLLNFSIVLDEFMIYSDATMNVASFEVERSGFEIERDGRNGRPGLISHTPRSVLTLNMSGLGITNLFFGYMQTYENIGS